MEKKTQQLVKFRNIAGAVGDNLRVLNNQLAGIIGAKKKIHESGVDGMMLRQSSDVLKTIRNLEQINSELPGAIDGVEELRKQADLLLKAQAGVRLDALPTLVPDVAKSDGMLDMVLNDDEEGSGGIDDDSADD